MIAVDTNILVYAHRQDSPVHAQARAALEILRSATGPWAIPWPCVHEFLGIVTHPRIFRSPTPLATAFAAVDSWQAAGNLRLLTESPGYLAKLSQLCQAANLVGPRVHDARVAALCLHHGIDELWTADRDFSVFPQLTTRNPLVKTP